MLPDDLRVKERFGFDGHGARGRWESAGASAVLQGRKFTTKGMKCSARSFPRPPPARSLHGLHGSAARMRVNLRASKCATGECCGETDLSRRSLQAKADWFPLRATAFCSAPVLRRFWDWFELPPDLARAHSAKIGDNRASIPHWRELRSSSCLRSQFQTGPPPAPAVPKRRSTARTTKRCRDKGRPLS